MGYNTKREKVVPHCPSIRAYVVRYIGLGRAAFSLLFSTQGGHRLHPFFIEREEMEVEGALKKNKLFQV